MQAPPELLQRQRSLQQRQLSRVRWAEALEQQQAVRVASSSGGLEQQQQQFVLPHHHAAPDKPCLKQQSSSFPFFTTAADAEDAPVLSVRRPRASGAENICGGDGCDDDASPSKKRSRLVAFGQ